MDESRLAINNPARLSESETEQNAAGISAYNDRATAMGIADISPTPQDVLFPVSRNNTITSATLLPASNLTIPQTIPFQTPTAELSASTDKIATDYLAQAQKEYEQAQAGGSMAEIKTQKSALEKAMEGLFGGVVKAQTEAQVESPELIQQRKDLADLNTTIANTNEAYRAAKDSISGRGDITKEGQASLLSNVETTYGRQLADLAIRQSVANQNISMLQTAADRKLALTLAPLQTRIDYLSKFKLANLDSLKKDEQAKIDAIIAGKNKLVEQETKKQETFNEALKALLATGARPSDSVVSQMQKDPLNSYSILAQEGYSLAKPSKGTGQPSTAYQQERNLQTLLSVDDLLGRVSGQTVGILSVGRFAPGSVQRDFAADLQTLKSNISLGQLNAMRQASKTGGALGNISDAEGARLEAALGSLDQAQSPANFRKNLQRIKDSIDRWNEAVGQYGTTSGISEEDQLRDLGYSEEQIQQIKEAQ